MSLKKTDSFFKVVLGCMLIVSPVSLLANSPVKSIDSAGNVTYSDKPVADAQAVTKVPIQTGPSASEIDAAQQQARESIKQADNIDLNSKSTTKKHKDASTSTEVERQVINAGSRNRPYATKPKPKPPANKPGINPPAQRPAGPRAGGRR